MPNVMQWDFLHGHFADPVPQEPVTIPADATEPVVASASVDELDGRT